MSLRNAPNSEAIIERRIEIHREREQARSVRLRQRRCFWSWPWGHTWGKERFSYRQGSYSVMHRTCVGCGKDGTYVD